MTTNEINLCEVCLNLN